MEVAVSPVDPPAQPNVVQLYGKVVDGRTRMFCQGSDGQPQQVGGEYVSHELENFLTSGIISNTVSGGVAMMGVGLNDDIWFRNRRVPVEWDNTKDVTVLLTFVSFTAAAQFFRIQLSYNSINPNGGRTSTLPDPPGVPQHVVQSANIPISAVDREICVQVSFTLPAADFTKGHFYSLYIERIAVVPPDPELAVDIQWVEGEVRWPT